MAFFNLSGLDILNRSMQAIMRILTYTPLFLLVSFWPFDKRPLFNLFFLLCGNCLAV